MTQESDREWVKMLNRQTRQSSYYAKLTTHKYKHLKGYVEYDQVMFNLARTRFAYEYFDIEGLKNDFIHRTSLLGINDLITEGFHSFWLAPSLFQAFLNTDIPRKLDSLRRSVKNAVLFLPKGLKTPDGVDVQWLFFNHRLTTDVFPPLTLGDFTFQTFKQDMDCVAITFYDIEKYQYSTNRPLYLVNGELTTKYENEKFILQTVEKGDIESEKVFMDRVFALVVNVILYLQTYHHEKNTVEKHVKKKGVKKNEKLTPYILGENYKTKSEIEKSSKTGQKKSTHWRRGHYRKQLVGKRENREYKLVWIEPVLVNAVVE